MGGSRFQQCYIHHIQYCSVCTYSTVEVVTPTESQVDFSVTVSKGIDSKTLNWPINALGFNSNEYK